jgi:hypothetical protein
MGASFEFIAFWNHRINGFKLSALTLLTTANIKQSLVQRPGNLFRG